MKFNEMKIMRTACTVAIINPSVYKIWIFFIIIWTGLEERSTVVMAEIYLLKKRKRKNYLKKIKTFN